MAESKGNTGTTRRGFMAAVGVGAAALAVPAGAAAATGRTHMAWPAAARAWPAAVEALKAQFRASYMAELQRFAEDIRPLFEAGTLTTTIDIDDPANVAAHDRLEALAAERFGLEVDETATDYVGDDVLADLINSVSPSSERWDPHGGWHHPCFCAQACIGSDVLDIARREGWGVRS